MYYHYETIIAIVIIQAIVCAIITAAIADSKGRSVGQWAFIGAVFSILGVLIAIGLADENVKETNRLLKAQNRLLSEIQDDMRAREEKKTVSSAPTSHDTAENME